jgi:hypothetical protein
VPPRFATAVYGVLEPFDETLRLASAGHPPVLVRDPDGKVRTVSAPAGTAARPGDRAVRGARDPFPPGSLLAAFTDGLVESRDVDVELGMSRIAARLEEARAAVDLEELADSLLTAAGADSAADDVALLLVRLSSSAAQLRRAHLLLSELSDVARARRAVAAIADAAQPGRSAAIVQVTSELAANAVEHAGPPVELRAFATRSGSSSRRRTAPRCRPCGASPAGTTSAAAVWLSSRHSPTPGASGSVSAARPPGPSSAPDPRRR